MTLRASTSNATNDRAKWIGSVDGTNVPIVTRHSASGTSETLVIYIFNDGKRDSDGENMSLEYKNVKIKPRGKRTRILTSLNEDITPFVNAIPVEDPRWYGSGTKLVTDPIFYGGNFIKEEFWVKSIQGNNLIVDRGQNNTTAITIPNRQWIEANPDHIYLSLTGKEGSWVQGELTLPDISDSYTPIKVYVRVSTGALRTQVKIDSYISIYGDEYPKF